MPDQHALLSASGAHRWLNCTPSAVLESGEPGSTSDAAEQGTAAHALAEHKLRKALKQMSKRPTSEWHDDEMENLTDDYAAYVLEQFNTAKAECADASLLIEQRLDFSHIVPGGFGIGDAVIIAEPRLHIIDLKYGMGVLLEAKHNPQLMLYALGALHAFGSLYDIGEVVVTIFQPRRSNFSTWTITTAELLAWAETVVAPKAILAATGGGQFAAGSWCQFCKLAPTCRARAEANLDLAKYEFAPLAELTDAEIADVLARLPLLTKWASDVEAYAASLAINQGKAWPGFKVVAGRSVRKYTDEAEAAKAAQAAGYTDIYDKELITVTAMEKLMGNTQFTEILGELIHKPVGKPALVPDTDKRPALHLASAADEFMITENTNKKATTKATNNTHNPSTRIVTGEIRLSYANVWEPKSIQGGAPKYNVSLIIPKSDTETLSAISRAIDAAIEAGTGKFGGKTPNKVALKLPLRDGDIEQDDEAYAGGRYSSMRTPRPHHRSLTRT